eukprot:m.166543 g.166543  ORF g.166543 m.166543 type:complete len:75 (+) comp53146_c0_seq10:690-914(+)
MPTSSSASLARVRRSSAFSLKLCILMLELMNQHDTQSNQHFAPVIPRRPCHAPQQTPDGSIRCNAAGKSAKSSQ